MIGSTTPITTPKNGSTTPITTPKNGSTTPITTPKEDNTAKILRIIRSTPDISTERLGEICNMTRDGVRYHIKKLRANGIIEWEGKPRNGRWIIKNEEK